MNLYLTDAIGVNKPGTAHVAADNETEATQKIIEFLDNNPEYKLFKTKHIIGNESDEIDYTIKFVLIVNNILTHPDINLIEY